MKNAKRRWAHGLAAVTLIGTCAAASGLSAPKPTEENWSVSIEEPWFILEIEPDFGLAFTYEEVFLLNGAIMECVNAAKAACGEGNICWIRVTGGAQGESCEFACRDAEGNCTPMPSAKDVSHY